MADIIRVGVLTVSDRCSRGEQEDLSGPAIINELPADQYVVSLQAVVPDEKKGIAATLRRWCDNYGCDVVVTTGGTGIAPRDITPEATEKVIDRQWASLSQYLLSEGLKQTSFAPLSRGIAGLRKSTIIVNLPGSPAAAQFGTQLLMHLLPHAVAVLKSQAAMHPIEFIPRAITMLTYDEAIARILNLIQPLPAVDLPLLDSLGLVLAEDVATSINIPSFANSAMDGFAVRSADIAEAAPDRPISLPISGETAAGAIEGQVLPPHSAMRIATGAPLPGGADAVVPVEDADAHGSTTVQINAAAEPGRFIRLIGEDVSAGTVVAARGSIMRPAEIGLCAAIGRQSVRVHPAPRIAIISTGNELIEPGNPILPGQIYNANSYALAAQVTEAGGVVSRRLHARDTPDSLRKAFTACRGVDIILTSGGISVGQHDHVKSVFAERGEVDFWRVAIRPGKPIAFGTWDSARFFGLPGNPVSSMVTFELFVRPALRKMRGHADFQRSTVPARLTEDAAHEPGRQSYLRAFANREGGDILVRPVGGQGSHQMRSMVLANALIILRNDIERKASGEFVDIMLLEALLPL